MQGMEAHFVMPILLSSPTILPMKLLSKDVVGYPLFPRKAHKKNGCSCIIPLSRRSAYQDFQGFANPSRLLPATEANIYTDISDEMFSSENLDKSNSLYIVKLRTSNEFGSCLRDINAAILLSLIDVNGDTILQRISAVSQKHPSDGNNTGEVTHFQRGSQDIVTFKGPKLGNIDSLWIGLESGSWRFDGVTLTVVNTSQSSPTSLERTKKEPIDVMQYKFEANNMLLGEAGVSVSELRPSLVTESPRESFSTLLKSVNPSSPTSSPEQGEPSNEESMKEYSDLKLSLLLYDAILFFSGSLIILSISSNERYAYSFLVGGIAGFLYLLLLQRSVDGLSAEGRLKNLKGPLFTLALIFAVSEIAVKNGSGGSSLVLTPAELFIGAAGFLTCKIAVLLAAFKPIKTSSKEEDK